MFTCPSIARCGPLGLQATGPASRCIAAAPRAVICFWAKAF